jgi:hypothetical protein
MTATSQESLQIALQIARRLPLHPPLAPGKPRSHIASHFRNEAYGKLLTNAIVSHNLGFARDIAEEWSAEGVWQNADNIAIATAWLEADEPGEAIAFSHRIESVKARIATQLFVAQRLLDEAGAPNF